MTGRVDGADDHRSDGAGHDRKKIYQSMISHYDGDDSMVSVTKVAAGRDGGGETPNIKQSAASINQAAIDVNKSATGHDEVGAKGSSLDKRRTEGLY